jgi:hypothetical protein
LPTPVEQGASRQGTTPTTWPPRPVPPTVATPLAPTTARTAIGCSPQCSDCPHAPSPSRPPLLSLEPRTYLMGALTSYLSPSALVSASSEPAVALLCSCRRGSSLPAHLTGCSLWHACPQAPPHLREALGAAGASVHPSECHCTSVALPPSSPFGVQALLEDLPTFVTNHHR